MRRSTHKRLEAVKAVVIDDKQPIDYKAYRRCLNAFAKKHKTWLSDMMRRYTP